MSTVICPDRQPERTSSAMEPLDSDCCSGMDIPSYSPKGSDGSSTFSPDFGSPTSQICYEEEDITGNAAMALAYYKEMHGDEYKFVEYERSNFIKDSFSKGHINFIAKPISADDGPSSYKRFFAELDEANCTWRVLACCILDGEMTVGCHGICNRVTVYHPPGGFHYGLYKPETVEGVGDKTCDVSPYPKAIKAKEIEIAKKKVAKEDSEPDLQGLEKESRIKEEIKELVEKLVERGIKEKLQVYEKQQSQLEKLVRELMEKVSEREEGGCCRCHGSLRHKGREM